MPTGVFTILSLTSPSATTMHLLNFSQWYRPCMMGSVPGSSPQTGRPLTSLSKRGVSGGSPLGGDLQYGHEYSALHRVTQGCSGLPVCQLSPTGQKREYGIPVTLRLSNSEEQI